MVFEHCREEFGVASKRDDRIRSECLERFVGRSEQRERSVASESHVEQSVAQQILQRRELQPSGDQAGHRLSVGRQRRRCRFGHRQAFRGHSPRSVAIRRRRNLSAGIIDVERANTPQGSASLKEIVGDSNGNFEAQQRAVLAAESRRHGPDLSIVELFDDASLQVILDAGPKDRSANRKDPNNADCTPPEYPTAISSERKLATRHVHGPQRFARSRCSVQRPP